MIRLLPPLAFDFGNPAMLWWSAAVAAPILIHLLSRRRYRETSWAAMEYLLAAMKKHSRRILIEQWVLLAVRVLVIALVVLAVSRPFLEHSPVPFSAGTRTHRLFVIDGSYSMGYEVEGTSCFQRAKELAAEIVEGASEGDGFTLVMMASPPRVIVGTPALAPSEFLRELEQSSLSHTSADLPATLEKVEEVLENAQREARGLTGQEVYFLTDLRRVGWQVELSGAARDQFLARTLRLDEQARLVILDVGQPDEENLAVTRVRAGTELGAKGSVVTLSEDATIDAHLVNLGDQTRSHQRVELLVDGRRVDSKAVDLRGGEKANESAEKPSVQFTYRFETAGDHAVEVRLEPDALDVDNHRWLSVTVKRSIDVLLVDGDLGGTAGRGAGDYLRTALAPWKTETEQGRVQVRTISESELLEEQLADYDCVFLADVAQFTADEAKSLRSYLDDGGGVVFFLGNRVLAQRYNEELWIDAAAPNRVLPARLGKTTTQGLYWVNPLEYRHAIVAPFRDHEKAGLLTTLIRRYVKLVIPKRTAKANPGEKPAPKAPRSEANVALAVAGNDPLIVEETIGKGRSIVVATGADPSWSLMPLWTSFVPIVQDMLSYAMSGRVAERNLLVGQELADTVPAQAFRAPLTIYAPDGRTKEMQLRLEGDACRWSYAPAPGFSHTTVSGVYRAVYGPPLSRSDVFAVNVDTAESDLERITERQLRETVWPDVDFEVTSTWEKSEQDVLAPTVPRGMLDKWILYLALGLLFVEMYLAWRFGRHG